MELRVLQDLLDQLVLKAVQVQLGHRDRKDQRETLACRDLRELLDPVVWIIIHIYIIIVHYWIAFHFLIKCNVYNPSLYLTGGAISYIRWGNSKCPAGETIVYSGKIVQSKNTKGVDGNYLCLPGAHNDDQLRAQSSPLTMEYVTDANKKTFPCVACFASGRSTVFTFPDNTICPLGWYAEYIGYKATNPKWPRENLCIDTYFGDKLRQSPCNKLALIAKDDLITYSSETQNAVSCVVCSK